MRGIHWRANHCVAIVASAAVLGCRAAPADRPDPSKDPPADTDLAVDTESDSPEVDTIDSTRVEETDDTEPADTERADTDTLTGPTVPGFGAGFVRVDAVLTTLGLATHVGDRTVRDDPPGDAGGFIADLDGDGTQDVVFVGLQRPGSTTPGDEGGTAVVSWDASSATLVPSSQSVAEVVDAMRLFGALDVDGDGRDDLVGTGWPQPVWFGGVRVPDNPRVDVPLAVLARARRVVPADLDHDGLLDLLLYTTCHDGGEALLVAWQEGPRHWHVSADVLPTPAMLSPYTLLVADLAGQGDVLQVMGAPCDASAGAASHAFFRVSGVDDAGRPRLEAYDPTPSTSSYKQSPVVAGGPISLANPMGETYADVDGDGQVELFIATSRDRLDVFSDAGGHLVERTQALNLLHPVIAGQTPGAAPWGAFHLPWAMATLDLDLDGRADLLVQYGDDHGTWVDQLTPDLAMRAWWNDGHGGFVAVEDRVGLDTPLGGHALTVGDLDGDGRPDLVQGGNGVLPRVLLNRTDSGHHALGLRLRGTTSHAEAFGAVVEVFVHGLPIQTLWAGQSATPVVLQHPMVFAGLGPSAVADTVRVTWPSGVVQELHGLPGDQTFTVVEPPVVQIVPATRRAPADGTSTLTVRIQPVALDGSPRVATVAVRRVAGVDVVLDAPVADGSAWTVTAHAPSAAGSTQLEVAIDGTPLKVKPRLFWTD